MCPAWPVCSHLLPLQFISTGTLLPLPNKNPAVALPFPQIDYAEFVAATLGQSYTGREEFVRALFTRLDADGSGFVSAGAPAPGTAPCSLPTFAEHESASCRRTTKCEMCDTKCSCRGANWQLASAVQQEQTWH